MKNLKKLTLLHSNDLHGDFLEEDIDGKLVGGVSMLSGYVSKVRGEEKNVIYAIAGDMFRGSVIDTEYLGVSTIEIMNLLAPDVVTLGNHETDYGLSHLLFIEKCAKFPIINANLHIKTNNTRLFNPCIVKKVDGMKILFIGILTEEVISHTKMEQVIGSMVDVYDAAQEITRICNSYHSVDIDLTVILTHIGFEEDKKLAEILDPSLGVDLIIGGHSHTFMEAPEVVNGIPIVQAGTGTDIIGRFDLLIDTDRNCIDSYQWNCVPIDNKHCPRDLDIENLINAYKGEVDKKYQRVVTRLKRQLTHPARTRETELGNLVCDMLRESVGLDMVMWGSGSIRRTEMGPVILFQDFEECIPYDDKVWLMHLTGAELMHAVKHICRDETWEGAHNEFYQYSRGFEIIYDRNTKSFRKFDFQGSPIEEERLYTLGIPEYHHANFDEFFDLSLKDVDARKQSRVVATSSKEIIEEYLSTHQQLDSRIEGRLVVLAPEE